MENSSGYDSSEELLKSIRNPPYYGWDIPKEAYDLSNDPTKEKDDAEIEIEDDPVIDEFIKNYTGIEIDDDPVIDEFIKNYSSKEEEKKTGSSCGDKK